MDAGVGERAVLGDRRSLQVRRTQVGERVAAGIVAVSVSSEEGAQVEDRIVTDDMGVGGRNIVGIDLGELIGVAQIGEGRACACASADHILHVEVVERIGSLEPGTAVVKVPMDRIGRGKAVIDAVKEILFVALVVEDGELGRIEKSARIKAVGLDEVAPAFAAVGEIEARRLPIRTIHRMRKSRR